MIVSNNRTLRVAIKPYWGDLVWSQHFFSTTKRIRQNTWSFWLFLEDGHEAHIRDGKRLGWSKWSRCFLPEGRPSLLKQKRRLIILGWRLKIHWCESVFTPMAKGVKFTQKPSLHGKANNRYSPKLITVDNYDVFNMRVGNLFAQIKRW